MAQLNGSFPQALVDMNRSLWWQVALLGALFTAFGIFVISYSMVSTLVSVVLIGTLLTVSGVIEIIHAIPNRKQSNSHLGLHVLSGVLQIFAGFVSMASPLAAAVTLTLIFSAYLVVAGIFRLVLALSAREFPLSGWMALSGVASTILGIALWSQWPVSGFWFIGLCVGIDLLMQGITWLTAGFALKRLVPESPAASPRIPEHRKSA